MSVLSHFTCHIRPFWGSFKPPWVSCTLLLSMLTSFTYLSRLLCVSWRRRCVAYFLEATVSCIEPRAMADADDSAYDAPPEGQYWERSKYPSPEAYAYYMKWYSMLMREAQKLPLKYLSTRPQKTSGRKK